MITATEPRKAEVKRFSPLASEDMIDVFQAVEQVQEATGLAMTPAAIRRWAKRGVSGSLLEAIKIAGRFRTSRQAVTRFLAKVTSSNN